VTGSWGRDLGADLDAFVFWGAVVVVTLLEPHELAEPRKTGVPLAGSDGADELG
jgi:hypothetical protein